MPKFNSSVTIEIAAAPFNLYNFAISHGSARRLNEATLGDFFFTSAKIDIDTLDYSVMRMLVIPRYIRGYDALVREAFNLGAKLFLESEIRFDKVYRSMRFPSYIRIEERYRGGSVVTRVAGSAGFIKSKTEFTYDNYRFFNVDMDIKN